MASAAFRHWMMALRPPTLLTGLAPVVIGNALGLAQTTTVTGTHVLMVVASVVAVILLQGAANLINDEKDAARGLDDDNRLGPQRVVATGVLTAEKVRRAYRGMLAVAFLLSIVLVARGGWGLVLLGMSCVAGAYLYTGGPRPLSYHGLGEVAAWIFFGPVAVGGCYYLQTLRMDPIVFGVGMGPGLWAAALMAINNYRDRDQDLAKGKRTVAGRLSPQAALVVPLVCLVAAIAAMTLYGWRQNLPIAATVIAVVFLAFVFNLIVPPLKQGGRSCNLALKRTAISNFLYGLAFAALIGAAA